MDEKNKEMESLQVALNKLRGANSGNRERGVRICSSEEELNDLVSFDALNSEFIFLSIMYCIVTLFFLFYLFGFW